MRSPEHTEATTVLDGEDIGMTEKITLPVKQIGIVIVFRPHKWISWKKHDVLKSEVEREKVNSAKNREASSGEDFKESYDSQI